MSITIINIDLQNDFFNHQNLQKVKASLVQNINKLNAWARKNNFPVIWVRQEIKADLSNAPLYNKRNNIPVTIENTEGSKLLPGLYKHDEDIEIIKTRFSAFFKTNLLDILKQNSIQTVIITGINTMTCVRTTAIDSYQNDYEVILAESCFYGYDIEQHENSIKYLQYSVAIMLSFENILTTYTKKTVHNEAVGFI